VRQRGVEAIGVFVLPPSSSVLETRLRGRSTESDAAIRRRLDIARQEISAFPEYEYLVVNDELEAAVSRLHGIVLAERARLARMRREAEAIVRTFEQRHALDRERT
jgi:guanylate kinase